LTTRAISFPLIPGPVAQPATGRGQGTGFERTGPSLDLSALGARFEGYGARRSGGSGSGDSESRTVVIIDGTSANSGESFPPVSTYLAQHIAQEVLPDGLYVDPHPAGIAAYRDVLGVTAAYATAASGFDLRA
jgi:hypothetical protein